MGAIVINMLDSMFTNITDSIDGCNNDKYDGLMEKRVSGKVRYAPTVMPTLGKGPWLKPVPFVAKIWLDFF